MSGGGSGGSGGGAGSGKSAEHRIGLVPCPLCKNIPIKREGCKACERAGMIPVDRAIEIGVSVSDTEREMQATKPPSSATPTERDPDKKDE